MPIYFASVLYYRFDFGVPLEDIFPPNDLHPKLKALYNCAHDSVQNSCLTAECILTDRDVSLDERLKIKECLLESYPQHKNANPGALIWLLRHFLGLLPIPLLPQYSNGENFEWFNISDKCKRIFQEYRKNRRFNCYLDYEIAKNVVRLPLEHTLLLDYHLSFLRKLSFNLIHNRRNCTRSLIYYSRYFSSSIFLRPFTPGACSKIDKHYHHLMMYLILRWFDIYQLCEMMGLPVFDDIKLLSSGKLYPDKTASESIDKIGKSDNNSSVISKKDSNRINSPSNHPSAVSIDLKTNLNSRMKSCCCSYGSNYQNSTKYSIDTIFENDVVYSESEIDSNTNNANDVPAISDDNNLNNIDYQMTTPEQPKNSRSSNFIDNAIEKDLSVVENPNLQSESSCHTSPHETEHLQNETENGSYMYDDYDTFKTERYNQIIDNPLELDPQLGPNRDFMKPISIDGELLKRVSKMGWTYIPPQSPGDNPTGYDKTSDQEREAEKAIAFENLIEESPVLVKSKSKRSMMSLKKFKPKFGFLKRLKSKSTSFEVLPTSIKYMKMEGIKSTTSL